MNLKADRLLVAAGFASPRGMNRRALDLTHRLGRYGGIAAVLDEEDVHSAIGHLLA